MPKLTDRVIDQWFEETFWPHAWPRGTPPMKVEKKGTMREYRKAIRGGDTSELLSNTVKAAFKRFMLVDAQYRPSVRKWLFNGGQYDEAAPSVSSKRSQSLEAAVWAIKHGTGDGHQFDVTPENVRACLDAGLVTEEQAEPWL